MTRTYTVNLAAPFILLGLVLLAIGTIPLTGLSVALLILLSQLEANVKWER
jgi:hypothetical protein